MGPPVGELRPPRRCVRTLARPGPPHVQGSPIVRPLCFSEPHAASPLEESTKRWRRWRSCTRDPPQSDLSRRPRIRPEACPPWDEGPGTASPPGPLVAGGPVGRHQPRRLELYHSPPGREVPPPAPPEALRQPFGPFLVPAVSRGQTAAIRRAALRDPSLADFFRPPESTAAAPGSAKLRKNPRSFGDGSCLVAARFPGVLGKKSRESQWGVFEWSSRVAYFADIKSLVSQ